jgi:hypothetical protein
MLPQNCTFRNESSDNYYLYFTTAFKKKKENAIHLVYQVQESFPDIALGKVGGTARGWFWLFVKLTAT